MAWQIVLEEHITLLWGQAKGRRQLFRILRATGAQVRFEQTLKGVDLSGCLLVVIDLDSLDENPTEELRRIEELDVPPAVLVLTSSDDKDKHSEILAYKSLTNLFAKNKDFEYTELIVAVQKIISNKIFGLERYVVWGVTPDSRMISGNADRRAALENFAEYLTDIGINRRLVELARSVADEFLLNALYNAALSQYGPEAAETLAQSSNFVLGNGEQLLFRYACDGGNLAFSVEDSYGQFEKAPLLQYIRESFEEGGMAKDEVGGPNKLSLYTAFRSLNHLIINVAPEARTELIGAMDISGSYRDFVSRPKSLHLFYQAS